MDIITNKVRCKDGFIFIPYDGEPLDVNQKYKISIKKYSKQRSINANAYAWVLMDKMARVLNTTKIDVYKKCIKDVGVFQTIPVRNDTLERFRSVWEQNGIGWQVEELGTCKQSKEFTNILAYYGTSTYTTKEMARFIEYLVDECKSLNIETLHEDRLNILIGEWGVCDE